MSEFSITLTSDDMVAAKDGAAGFEKVWGQVQPVIKNMACGSASRVVAGGGGFYTLAEELEAAASATLWDLVLRFDAASVKNVGGWLVENIRLSLHDARGEILNPGADQDAMKLFVKALRDSEGDAEAAERAIIGPKCSADRAFAAKLAFVGSVSMDMPDGSGNTLSDIVSDAFVNDLTDAEPDEYRSQRIKAVQDVLALMSETQRSILEAVYGRGLTSDQARDALGMTVDAFKRNKEKARRTFYRLFPWEAVYGTDKPEYMSESAVKKESKGDAKLRWNDAKLKAALFPFEMTGQLRPCTLCDSPMAPGHASWCLTHTATFKARAVRAVNNNLVTR